MSVNPVRQRQRVMFISELDPIGNGQNYVRPIVVDTEEPEVEEVREPSVKSKVEALFDNFAIDEVMRAQKDRINVIHDDFKINRARNQNNLRFRFMPPQFRELREDEADEIRDRLEEVADHQVEVQNVIDAHADPDQPEQDLAGFARDAISRHLRELGRIYDNMFDAMDDHRAQMLFDQVDEGFDMTDDEDEGNESDEEDDEYDFEADFQQRQRDLEEAVDVEHAVAFHELVYQYAYGRGGQQQDREDPIE